MNSDYDKDVVMRSNTEARVEWTYVVFTEARWSIIDENSGTHRFHRHAQLLTYPVILSDGPIAQTSL